MLTKETGNCSNKMHKKNHMAEMNLPRNVMLGYNMVLSKGIPSPFQDSLVSMKLPFSALLDPKTHLYIRWDSTTCKKKMKKAITLLTMMRKKKTK